MCPFAGYEMPTHYKGIVEEHTAVRTHAGIFDVSHMGEIFVSGKYSAAFLQHLVTNNVDTAIGKGVYSPMCKEDGTIVDDLIIYRLKQERFLVLVNASNIEKDFTWMLQQTKGFSVQLENQSDAYALIALQGPKAQEILQKLTALPLATLLRFHIADTHIRDLPCLIARTGYTGEDGFELCMRNEYATTIWQALETDAQPIGLGARDTLRLEAGLMLYGNDIDETSTPLEAPLRWTVKMEKEFIGKQALMRQSEQGIKRTMIGFELLERGIPRHDYPIVDTEGKIIGKVTSGTLSSTLGKGIGMGYVPTEMAKENNEIHILVREKALKAKIVKLPFYKRS